MSDATGIVQAIEHADQHAAEPLGRKKSRMITKEIRPIPPRNLSAPIRAPGVFHFAVSLYPNNVYAT